MTAARRITLDLPGPEATEDLATALAPHLRAGDTILLEGPLGAGKTHLARALIQTRLTSAGLPATDVPSPTYTLVQTYDAGDVEIWHTDLYRLGDPGEVIELGLSEAMEDAIVLIEWPDRLGALTPDAALRVDIAVVADGDARRATLSSASDRWADVLAALAPEKARSDV